MPNLFEGFSTYDRTHKDNKLYDIELVKRDLLNQFYTRQGHRVMSPEYGTIIWDMIFEPFVESNKNLIRDDVERIVNSDSRVSLDSVIMDETEHGLRLQISLYFIPMRQIESFEVEFDRRAMERT